MASTQTLSPLHEHPLTYDAALTKHLGQWGPGQWRCLLWASLPQLANAAAFFLWVFITVDPVANHSWQCRSAADAACAAVYQQKNPSSESFCGLSANQWQWTNEGMLSPYKSAGCSCLCAMPFDCAQQPRLALLPLRQKTCVVVCLLAGCCCCRLTCVKVQLGVRSGMACAVRQLCKWSGPVGQQTVRALKTKRRHTYPDAYISTACDVCTLLNCLLLGILRMPRLLATCSSCGCLCRLLHLTVDVHGCFHRVRPVWVVVRPLGQAHPPVPGNSIDCRLYGSQHRCPVLLGDGCAACCDRHRRCRTISLHLPAQHRTCGT